VSPGLQSALRRTIFFRLAHFPSEGFPAGRQCRGLCGHLCLPQIRGGVASSVAVPPIFGGRTGQGASRSLTAQVARAAASKSKEERPDDFRPVPAPPSPTTPCAIYTTCFNPVTDSQNQQQRPAPSILLRAQHLRIPVEAEIRKPGDQARLPLDRGGYFPTELPGHRYCPEYVSCPSRKFTAGTNPRWC
jgi:hypothetical protein